MYVCLYLQTSTLPGAIFFSGETFGKQYLPFVMGLGPPKCLLLLLAIPEIMRVSTYMIIYV